MRRPWQRVVQLSGDPEQDGFLTHPPDQLDSALEEQRNGEWRYLEFLQVTSWITAGIFMREIPGGDESQVSVPPS